MQLPIEVSELCRQYSDRVRQDPQHDLQPLERKKIYDAFDRSSEPKIWERLHLEMKAVATNPDLNHVEKVLRREAIYKAMAPARDLAIESILEKESAQARKDPAYHQLLSRCWKTIPDYYGLLPALDPLRYRVAGRLGILTARYIIPVWKKVLEDSEVPEDAGSREDLFSEFYSWVEQSTDNNTRPVLLEILNEFPRDKQQMRQKVERLNPPAISRQWKEATLHLLDGDEFEARIGAFLARGEEAPWVEAVESVSNYDLPDFMLVVAEKVLDGVVSHRAAREVADMAFIMLGNIPEIYELSPLANAAGTAFGEALGQTITGLQTFKHRLNQNPAVTGNESMGDVAGAAANTYSEIYEDFEFVEVDLRKRLEFWEWWLSEAIPQAWEVA
ncbi:MAG TPA: hypothetical protein VH186_20920 [Chloroflexia bacterium]|nr:hypothetical protein [Chloroflexia bacterium]